MWRKRSATFRYMVLGLLFGLLFPIFSTLGSLFLRQLPLTLENVVQVQRSNPLHWVIDTAPIFLGLIASFAGRRQDQLMGLNIRLEQQVRESEQTLHQLEALQASLEQQVAQRTADLTTAVDVGRAAASILELEILTRQVVDLVRERFGLYYAGLFLLDDAGEYAVLEAGTGEAGRIMKERGHKLEVGGVSMVGAACARSQARIALDVGEEPVRFDNPLLPDTRSEMALPLRVGDRVLGALDVQSTEPVAFSEGDISVLQLVADQVAVAVDNARTFSQETELLEATSPLFRVSHRMVSAVTTEEIVEAIVTSVAETEADGCVVGRLNPSPGGGVDSVTFLGDWNRFGASQFPAGVTFPASASPLPLHKVMSFWSVEDITRDPQMREGLGLFLAGYGGRSFISIPLQVGSQVIGFISMFRAEAGPFSPVSIRLYETLVDQAAVAMERARLLDEAQRRAARGRLIAEVSGRMRETLDVGTVLRTAVDEIGGVLGLAALEVRLSTELESEGEGDAAPSTSRELRVSR